MHKRSLFIASCLIMATCVTPFAHAAGKIKGTTGGIERGAIVFDRNSEMKHWTITGPSGLYEFGGLEAGEYIMLLHGKIVPYVRVEDGKTTVVDQATQPKFALETEVWGPPRVKFAQTFVATGTRITGYSLWRTSGNSKLIASLYEDSPEGKRIAGPVTSEKDMTWICWTSLPTEGFVTVPGKKYAFELIAADDKPWNMGGPRHGDVYPEGFAYFDGVPHPESDLGLTLNEDLPGLMTIVSARDDQHYIAEGPGSGSCTVAGQTFIANTTNAIKAWANCGFNDGVQEFIFSIHEDGPGGKQVGPAPHTKMVTNWGSDVIWFPGAVKLEVGKQYYLQYRRVDGKPFFSYLSSDQYKKGRAFRDGKMIEERFDQLCGVVGEAEPDGIIYPYNVRVTDITDTTVTLTWRTGTAGDEFVHVGTTKHLHQQVGSEDVRKKDHTITLTDLKPGTSYLYRVSSHTHKKSTRRIYSRIYGFMTRPAGADESKFNKPLSPPPPPACNDCIQIVNPGFEEGLKGWKRIAKAGREKEPERYKPVSDPFGHAITGNDGYDPHSGSRVYGWSNYGPEDPTWKEPREDWKCEIIRQTIDVEAGKDYELTVWILTGDRGTGWGRDSRIRIAVDEANAGLLENFDAVNESNITQWFATQHAWMPVTLRFKAKANRVTIGAEFLQWWSLEANHLYIDEFTVRPVE